jgi:glycosyl transferase family 25
MDRIDKFIYINLDSRPDRNNHIQNELKRFGIPKEKIIRISAVQDERGARGCSLSQANMAEAFRDSGDKVWCFLEDDHYFTQTREDTDKIVNTFLDDERFDVFLGCYCNVKGYDWKGTPFRRTSQSSMTSFYIAKKKVCEALLASHLESARSMNPKYGKKRGTPCDFMWEHIMKVFVFVAPYKPYGSQIISYSNIRNKVMNYSNYVGLEVTQKL